MTLRVNTAGQRGRLHTIYNLGVGGREAEFDLEPNFSLCLQPAVVVGITPLSERRDNLEHFGLHRPCTLPHRRCPNLPTTISGRQ